MKLHNVTRNKGGNRYCGPAVISALTGCDTDFAARLLRMAGGRTSIKGSSYAEVLDVLLWHGIEVVSRDTWFHRDRPTLAQWLASTVNERTPGKVFLIAAGNHWQLVSGRRYVCGRTGTVVSVRAKHKGLKRRARVESVWELGLTHDRVRLNSTIASAIEEQDRVKAERDKERRKGYSIVAQAKRLAKELDLEVEVQRGFDTNYWVYPGESWTDDPLEDGHCAYDGYELMEIVGEYEKFSNEYRRAA